MIFQVGNVYESASLFNLKEKKNYMKDSTGMRTHDLDSPVYSQVTQARNMSIGEHRHCCVTFKL